MRPTHVSAQDGQAEFHPAFDIDFIKAELNANRKLAGMMFDLTIPGGMGGKAWFLHHRSFLKGCHRNSWSIGSPSVTGAARQQPSSIPALSGRCLFR